MICKNCGVKESTIKDVILRKSWKHVTAQVGGEPSCLNSN